MSRAGVADLNGDHSVDGNDLTSVLSQWGTNGTADRRKRAEEEAARESAATAQQRCGAGASAAIEIIEHRESKPRRIPSRSWRELIKKVWEVDPLLCPKCHHEMRIVSLINDAQIIERILRHVGSGGVDQWVSEICNHGVRIAPSTGPPVGESVAVAMAGIIECGQLVIEPWLDDPMPDYDSNPPLWQVRQTRHETT